MIGKIQEYVLGKKENRGNETLNANINGNKRHFICRYNKNCPVFGQFFVVKRFISYLSSDLKQKKEEALLPLF